MNTKNIRKDKRHLRIRTRLIGDNDSPRLVVFRSNLHIYGMLVDDQSGKTLLSSSDKEFKGKLTKTEKANQVGKVLAEKALGKKIKKIKFDRGGYLYHGRVKALAEGAREGGLDF